MSGSGAGFPASNSADGSDDAPDVGIYYEYGSEKNQKPRVARVTPDASGNIQTSFNVPGKATIGSHRVRASFDIEKSDGSSETISLSVPHAISAGSITLSMTEGMLGDSLTVTGEGFKSYTSFTHLKIGGEDVTPSPTPRTDANGMFTATIVVPGGLNLGSNNVEVNISDNTASASFTVVDTPATTPGTAADANEAAAPADAFAAVIADDGNLLRVWHFDPSKQNDADANFGWSLYDSNPLFASLNTLEMIEPGNSYWVQVDHDQMGVMLGGKSVDLYAPWNLVSW